jgi:serine/threonine protein kinase
MTSNNESEARRVATITANFERMNMESLLKNQEMSNFFGPRRNHLCSATKSSFRKEAYRGSKLRSDDETEVTVDESCEFSDSFSLSCSSLSSSSHRSHHRWLHSAAGAHNSNSVTKLPSFPFELEEDDSSSATSPSSHIASTTHLSTNVEDWDLVKIIGEGAFGQVFQVERKCINESFHDDNRSYALKMLSKYQLVCDGQVDVVIMEKKLLQRASQHPFVVKLLAAWQDENLIYLLQEFVQGGELYSLMLGDDDPKVSRGDALPPRKELPEQNVKFYAACIAEALHYLHSKCNIVYRDLKPENVLLDDRGYPLLIDLGAAKLLTDDSEYQTYTLCGTPRYVAPEQLAGSGHSFGVDHWALAVLVYEMLSSVHPFDAWDGTDEVSLYNSIVDDSYPSLPHFVSQNARDWVDQLLVKDPIQRMGCSLSKNDRSDLQLHPWLSEMNVAALRRRAVRSPWVPTLLNLHDSTHFDDWDHLDPVVSTNYPKLSVREAALFDAFDHA